EPAPAVKQLAAFDELRLPPVGLVVEAHLALHRRAVFSFFGNPERGQSGFSQGAGAACAAPHNAAYWLRSIVLADPSGGAAPTGCDILLRLSQPSHPCDPEISLNVVAVRQRLR